MQFVQSVVICHMFTRPRTEVVVVGRIGCDPIQKVVCEFDRKPRDQMCSAVSLARATDVQEWPKK